MATAFICQACTDAKSNSELVLTAGQPLCSECFIRGVKPDFIAALRSETNHPVKYNSKVLDINDFASFFTPEFLAAYNIKLQEYHVPIRERLYCNNNNVLIGSTQHNCGQFLGSKALIEEAAVRCSGCSIRVCTTCSNSFSNDGRGHMCVNVPEVDAFEGLERGVDYQICPGCQAKVQLREACNHMTCTMCQTEFCYLCGRISQHGHWGAGMPCPQYGRERGPRGLNAPGPAPLYYNRADSRIFGEILHLVGRAGLEEWIDVGWHVATMDGPEAFGRDEAGRDFNQRQAHFGALIREGPIGALLRQAYRDGDHLAAVRRRAVELDDGRWRQPLETLIDLLRPQYVDAFFAHLQRGDQAVRDQVLPIEARIHAHMQIDTLSTFLNPQDIEPIQGVLQRYFEAWDGNGEAVMQRIFQATQEMRQLQDQHRTQLTQIMWADGMHDDIRQLSLSLSALDWVYTVGTEGMPDPVPEGFGERFHEGTMALAARMPPELWENAPGLREIFDTYVNAREGRFDGLGRIIRP